MSNDHILESVHDFVHGQLDRENRERVETHCETCEQCAAELRAAQELKATMDAVPPVEASEDLIRATLGRVDGRINRRIRVRRWYIRSVVSVAALSALVVGGMNFYFDRLHASPVDLTLQGQTEWSVGSQASVRFTMFDRESESLLADVPVSLSLVDTDGRVVSELGDAKTDDRGYGTAHFQLPDSDAGRFTLRLVAETSHGEEVLTHPVVLKREWQLYVSSDKPVYQPGQVIRMRSLALRRPDRQPVAGEEVTIEIQDPKGNTIFRQQDVTTRFGMASADCQLARELIEGPYTISCRVGETVSSTTVDVQPYVLPKFQASIQLDRSFYAPGQRVRGTVQAKYFFGKAVVGGQGSVKLMSGELGGRVLDEVEVTTDDEGNCTFEFVLPQSLAGLPQENGAARVRVFAEMEDTAGQSFQTGVSRLVTRDSIRLDVIPESGQLVQGVPNRIYVLTTFADGRPARTRLAVNGRADELESSDLGLTVMEVTPDGEEIGLTLRASAVADGQLIGRKHVELSAGMTSNDFLVRTDRAVYTAGETVDVMALGGGAEPIFLEWILDDQCVLSQRVDVSDGKGQLQFDLPPDLFGTMQLCAYRFNSEGVAVMKLRTVQVQAAQQVQVAAELDRQEYRPGSTARLNVKLSDADGNPLVGAVSLSAVDEAVYHVMSRRMGLERTFFELEQELLEPIYAVYSWDPFQTTDPSGEVAASRRDLEQALFSLTSETVRASNLRIPGRSTVVDTPAGPARQFSPWTMSKSTYPDKAARIKVRRKDGLAWSKQAWRAWSWSLGIAFAVGLIYTFPRTCAVLTGLGLIYWFLPLWYGGAAGSAVSREANMATPMAGAAADDDAAGAEAADAGAEWDFAGDGDAPMDGFDDDPAATTTEDAKDPVEQPNVAPAQAAKPPRVRKWFPETLLWRPQVITDESGQASVEIELADSITTWRLGASAVSADGRLGSLRKPIRVFQPFFVDFDLPIALVRNDEVEIPVVVYNYLDVPQTVELELVDAEWFELLGERGAEETIRRVDLEPGAVLSTFYRLKASRVGQHALQITARGTDLSDAVRRTVTVDPDGEPVEAVHNGVLADEFETDIVVPGNIIPGSVRAIVKLYPSTLSQLVDGLDGIFRRPAGCFEQTSSTTYPNVLALRYLLDTKTSSPEIEAKARQYIHLGYQRLLTFEVDGGGFEWFGHSPANKTLTAYGLMEFVDMAEVYDVDPKLINRTRYWLERQRRPDGRWPADIGMLDDGLAGSVQRGDRDLATTAYIAWAVFRAGQERMSSNATLDYLQSQAPADIQNSHTLAVVTNALNVMREGAGAAYAEELIERSHASPDGKKVWWTLGEDQSTTFHGSGTSGNIEVTALAILALADDATYATTVGRALAWLIDQRDAQGTWKSTQATVLALQALLKGASRPREGTDRKIVVEVDGEVVHQLVIPKNQEGVVQQLDISELIGDGSHRVRIVDQTKAGTGYQLMVRHYVPSADRDETRQQSLSIDLTYDRTQLRVDDRVTATAVVKNVSSSFAPMVIVDLPIPPGFRVDRSDFAAMLQEGKIAKFEVTPRSVVLYLRGLGRDTTETFRYRLDATLPVKVQVPAAAAYEYYDPDQRVTDEAIALEVAPRS